MRKALNVLLVAILFALLLTPASIRASSYSDAVLADAPESYYRLGEASGTSATDSSGHSHTGTYTGGVTLGTNGAIQGDSDKAVTLDGTNDYVSVPSLALANTSFSVEVWIKPVTHPTHDWQDIFVALTGIYSDNKSLILRLYNTGTLGFFYVPDELYSSSPISFGVWTHLVIVYNSGTDTSTIYINGVASNSNSAGPFAGSNPSMSFGSTDWFAIGDVDEAAIYLSALSTEQIEAHYTAAGYSLPTPTPTTTATTPTPTATATATLTPTPPPWTIATLETNGQMYQILYSVSGDGIISFVFGGVIASILLFTLILQMSRR